MDKKIISALNKQFKDRLGKALPDFALCPDEAIDKKAYMNGMKAYCAPFESRFGYIVTIPYVKSYNGFAVDIRWAPMANTINYCMPMKSFKFQLFWEDHGSIPEAFSECEISLHSLAKENGFCIRESNIRAIEIAREEIANKEKLASAVDKVLDEVMADIEQYGLPLLKS